MNIIKCPKCNAEIELSEALKDEIKSSLIIELDKKHAEEIESVKKKAAEEAGGKLTEQLKILKEQTETDKQEKAEMREQMKGLIEQIRKLTKDKDDAELNAEKKLLEKEAKIKEDAEKNADEKQRLNIAARDKTISDLKKALDEAQRKASQGSQQLQGEIMELDFEDLFASTFRDDEISPVAKGEKGGDIKHTVRSPRGTNCGVILWEIKRTKSWVDSWATKLKNDLRAEKANIPIIISEVLPKAVTEDIGTFDGVWVCKPKMAVILGTLLRKSLLDAGLQKALAENRGTKADALYSFVTSHEFVQQVEAMIETYRDMTQQVGKERVAYEKFWSEREKQAQKLLLSTANIIGSMQGHIGQSSMPRIKGLELLSSGEEEQGKLV